MRHALAGRRQACLVYDCMYDTRYACRPLYIRSCMVPAPLYKLCACMICWLAIDDGGSYNGHRMHMLLSTTPVIHQPLERTAMSLLSLPVSVTNMHQFSNHCGGR